ncbi:MAG: single-stranded DNA-binding protein [Erysipelothrix sp.]|nr:single-stranded DNA-binding protein [Erysipelothrix sp.]
MVNRVVLVGRLTKDPMLRKTQTGKSVLSFTVAVNRQFSQEDQADFVNCVAWEKTAEFLNNYARKGSLVSVEGRIQSRSYDDKDGRRVYVQEVVSENVQLLESRSVSESRSMESAYQVDVEYDDFNNNNNDQEDDGLVLDISSDDLPF